MSEEEMAQALRAAGWTIKPPPAPRAFPAKWQVGTRVRYVRSTEWGPSKGDEGTIIRVRAEDQDKPGNAYQVFWVRLDNWPSGQFWTTPDAVTLISEQVTP